jgi:hypothetical protein
MCLFHPKVIFDMQRQLHLSMLRLSYKTPKATDEQHRQDTRSGGEATNLSFDTRFSNRAVAALTAVAVVVTAVHCSLSTGGGVIFSDGGVQPYLRHRA